MLESRIVNIAYLQPTICPRQAKLETKRELLDVLGICKRPLQERKILLWGP